jgi:hypothetical protein
MVTGPAMVIAPATTSAVARRRTRRNQAAKMRMGEDAVFTFPSLTLIGRFRSLPGR